MSLTIDAIDGFLPILTAEPEWPLIAVNGCTKCAVWLLGLWVGNEDLIYLQVLNEGFHYVGKRGAERAEVVDFRPVVVASRTRLVGEVGEVVVVVAGGEEPFCLSCGEVGDADFIEVAVAVVVGRAIVGVVAVIDSWLPFGATDGNTYIASVTFYAWLAVLTVNAVFAFAVLGDGEGGGGYAKVRGEG